jgi:pSer/pThr/pTyr-binding forkhead associated (FHA) protein
MDLQLIVLAGAKHGTRIPLKKSKFVIGRASECTLRAGSEAVSRRHCAILRGESGWTVRDLGSRNGTILNDAKIEGEMPLKVGDELAVGPLKFRVEEVPPRDKAKPEESKQEDKQQDAKQSKSSRQPPVKDVGDVVQRTAAKNNDSATEDDISRWLLGISEGDDAMKETRTISMEETGALAKAVQQQPEKPAPKAAKETAVAPLEVEADTNGANVVEESEDADSEASKSGSWSWLKFGKGKDKKQPGKLPKRANEQSKDSREAAADILREMTRRH